MQKITPNLWFDTQAEEAVKLYTSLFPNSKIGSIARYPKSAEEVSGKPAGSVMTIAFQINGQDFLALNGGPAFKFNESISFIVNCDTQEEIDTYWTKLTGGGEESVCGWLKDKFGLSWQIVPAMFDTLMGSGDAQKSERMMAALLQMKKLDIAGLK